LVYRVKGIDLRVGSCTFTGFEGLEGVYIFGVRRLIGRDTNWLGYKLTKFLSKLEISPSNIHLYTFPTPKTCLLFV
jgi:hypothetical protein